MDLDTPMTGLEQQIRETYIVERKRYMLKRLPASGGQAVDYKPGRQWDGGTDGKRTYQPIWPKIADFVRQHRLDAVRLIQSQFQFWNDNVPPHPNQMYSAKALDNYHKGNQNRAADIESALRSQRRTCWLEFSLLYRTTDWPLDAVWGHVLFNEMLELSALFRLCMGYKMRQQKVVNYYLVAAACQYIPAAELYDQLWKDFVPSAFRKKAEQIYLTAYRQ